MNKGGKAPLRWASKHGRNCYPSDLPKPPVFKASREPFWSDPLKRGFNLKSNRCFLALPCCGYFRDFSCQWLFTFICSEFLQFKFEAIQSFHAKISSSSQDPMPNRNLKYQPIDLNLAHSNKKSEEWGMTATQTAIVPCLIDLLTQWMLTVCICTYLIEVMNTLNGSHQKWLAARNGQIATSPRNLAMKPPGKNQLHKLWMNKIDASVQRPKKGCLFTICAKAEQCDGRTVKLSDKTSAEFDSYWMYPV